MKLHTFKSTINLRRRARAAARQLPKHYPGKQVQAEVGPLCEERNTHIEAWQLYSLQLVAFGPYMLGAASDILYELLLQA
jgi:hypothetical protein